LMMSHINNDTHAYDDPLTMAHMPMMSHNNNDTHAYDVPN